MTKDNVHHRPCVYGTGLIALDLVMGADPAEPTRSWAGGTCGNVLAILAFLGWDSYPVARLNDDPASERVKADLSSWGVHLDFTQCAPTSDTPIIIQQIRRGKDGTPTHRFSWSCPHCGHWLPGHKPVTARSVDVIAAGMHDPSVFFMDRLSRASLRLASRAAEMGALVVFEPSAKSDEKLLAEALQLAHVVKYADQRMNGITGVMSDQSAVLLEVQTLGAQGLRFRHRLGGRVSDWDHLPALPSPILADTCGSGDWCTAGLLARTASHGRAAFETYGVDGIRDALRYGQALAAWNCGFEGARGGMYAVSKSTFMEQVDAILLGRVDWPQPGQEQTAQESKMHDGVMIACPACPPDQQRIMPVT